MKARLLIVDDEPDFLNLLEFNLLRQGYEVISAATGFEGLRRARLEAPALIILDMMLPDVNGLSVCEILRDQPATRHVPIIILSALDAPVNGSRRAKPKFSWWLKKGTSFDELRETVRCALADPQPLKSHVMRQN